MPARVDWWPVYSISTTAAAGQRSGTRRLRDAAAGEHPAAAERWTPPQEYSLLRFCPALADTMTMTTTMTTTMMMMNGRW